MKLRSALVAASIAVILHCLAAGAQTSKPLLRFRPDGSFKIIQFTDLHYGPDVEPRTVALINEILDSEKPDFVVMTGDCVATGRCQTKDDLTRLIDAIAQPMETRKLAWAVTLGNHDRDNLDGIGITQEAMLGLYMSYAHNVNKASPRGVYGAGNAFLPIGGSRTSKPGCGVWLLDSNAYAPAQVGGQKMGGYDWIHFSQVKWYWDTSVALEKRYGGKIPSLMFFHIPLREYLTVMESGEYTGEKNRGCSCSHVNSGLFAAVLERGDVKGIFVGHDHTNTLVGELYGIKLGFSGSIGYGGYGLGGKDETEKNRLRGGRVFLLQENDPSSFTTSYVTAAGPNQTTEEN